MLYDMSVYEGQQGKMLYIVGHQNVSTMRLLKISAVPPQSQDPPLLPNQQQQQQQYQQQLQLQIVDDRVEYSVRQMHDLLQMLDAVNKQHGGLKLLLSGVFGLLGAVQFTTNWYLYVITKAAVVSQLNHCDICSIEQVKLLKIPSSSAVVLQSSSQSQQQSQQLQQADEGKRGSHAAVLTNDIDKIDMLSLVDLRKNCYFSYHYDLTLTLQNQTIPCNNCSSISSSTAELSEDYTSGNGNKNDSIKSRDQYIWNWQLMQNLVNQYDSNESNVREWLMPIVYGFVECAAVSYSTTLTLLARRSRHMAGVRYLKRGCDKDGWAANEVETEQILAVKGAASAHYASSDDQQQCSQPVASSCGEEVTAYVQLRGSIPLQWSQHHANNMAVKPPIVVHRDPFHVVAAKHFRRLMRDSVSDGGRCVVVNLVKQSDRRESTLLDAYTDAVQYLNLFLEQSQRISYVAFDMARALKQSDSQNTSVLAILQQISEECMQSTGYYHRTADGVVRQRQCGIVRTNCIDCLDRTNAAQFILGKVALARQLVSMRQLSGLEAQHMTFDVPVVSIMMRMYHDMGDEIALQYGGSALVNTMETYRRRGGGGKTVQRLATPPIKQTSRLDGDTGDTASTSAQIVSQEEEEEEEIGGMGMLINLQSYMSFVSHSRDIIESIKRYYSNSFTDAEKQDAINLFLGVGSSVQQYTGVGPNVNPDHDTSRRHVRGRSLTKWYDEQEQEQNLADNQQSFDDNIAVNQQLIDDIEADKQLSNDDDKEALTDRPLKLHAVRKMKLQSFADLLQFRLFEQACNEGRDGLTSPFSSESTAAITSRIKAKHLRDCNRYKNDHSKIAPNHSEPDVEFVKQLSEQEMAEYARYCTQFSTCKLTKDGDVIGTDEDHVQNFKPDDYNQQYYEKYVKCDFDYIPEQDLQLYEDYCK